MCGRIDYQYKFNSSKGTVARQEFTNVEKNKVTTPQLR